MQSASLASAGRDRPLVSVLVVLGAFVIAAASALPYAGSWNDGSRLAAVESIADRGSLAIDDSLFVRVPADTIACGVSPYPPQRRGLLEHGTRDRLFIRGHFYSDKPYVVSFLMAGIYKVCNVFGLPRAAERPDLFCRVLTILTSGLAYAVAVWCVYLLALRVGLPPPVRLALTASFALSTVALPYTRHVNNHILHLGVTAALVLQLVYLAAEATAATIPWRRPLLLGTLAGLAYNLDLGAGPVLLACLFPLIVYRCRRPAPVLVFLAALAPWLLAHHAINYAVGGVLKPMNAVAEYSDWPGSPFSKDNLTGFFRHTPLQFGVYALSLLFGKHGFITHNLPLFLALPAFVFLLRRRSPARPEIAFGAAWCAGTWLMYAAFSNNSGGVCCSVRWFVPFLAPAYHTLALYLQQKPRQRLDFCILSLWGGLLGVSMWWHGPWIQHGVPLLWPLVGAGLLAWLACHYARCQEQLSIEENREMARAA
ncbi:MAG: hypothetical protein HYS12_04925 [Planctomycetes bacterium]|nr:hypothetical protein [Planctomycetota bacterium]